MGTAVPQRAFVGLGSNLDDPVRQVETAMAELDALPCTRLVRRSRLYRTKPVGPADQPDFINGCAEVETCLDAHALLRELLALEQRHHRVRTRPNGPRTLDLDLLLYDQTTLDTPELQLPHPRMHERAFVLVPLAELAPQAMIPGHGQVATLAARVGTADVHACEDA